MRFETSMRRSGQVRPRDGIAAALVLTVLALAPTLADAANGSWPMIERDPVKLELVMQLVVTCSNPESLGGAEQSKGKRHPEAIWSYAL
jgi:hypothetical protein